MLRADAVIVHVTTSVHPTLDLADSATGYLQKSIFYTSNFKYVICSYSIKKNGEKIIQLSDQMTYIKLGINIY